MLVQPFEVFGLCGFTHLHSLLSGYTRHEHKIKKKEQRGHRTERQMKDYAKVGIMITPTAIGHKIRATDTAAQIQRRSLETHS
eukprot:COSAG02_NODE_992_length_15399_cov_164.326797_11_plen_83_part_00